MLRYQYILFIIFLGFCSANREEEGNMNFVELKEKEPFDDSFDTLVWEDDFNETMLNEEFWNFELADGCPDLCGWGNNELQNYTDRNHRIEDGILIISVQKESEGYTSTRITTKDKKEFQYGKIEARLKVPVGDGLWPAFWALGYDIDELQWPLCGEIDIMEYVGRRPGEVFNTLHTQSSYGDSVNSKITAFPNVEDDFHVFGIKWTPEVITFLIDNKAVYSYSPVSKNGDNWPFNKPFYLLLNVAVGGNFGGPVGQNTVFPQEFLIDYVRVYQ